MKRPGRIRRVQRLWSWLGKADATESAEALAAMLEVTVAVAKRWGLSYAQVMGLLDSAWVLIEFHPNDGAPHITREEVC